VIASSIQFLSPDHEHEKWANFPKEKKKLIEILDRLNVKNAIIISGDIHHAELSAETTPGSACASSLIAAG
jgi:alkaline phosphatase D